MKTKILFSILSFTLLLLLLALLLPACKNAESSKADAVETEQEEVESTEGITTSSEPAGEVTVGEQEEKAEAPQPSMVAEEKKANTPPTVKAKPTAPEKNVSPQSNAKAAETKPVQAPKAEMKPEAEKATPPATVKKDQPAAPQTTPAPKPETAAPSVAETKKAEEAPATKPAPPAPAQQASQWPVPDSYDKKANPIKVDKESIALGKSLWDKHCKSCHGKEGLGDGSKAAQLDTSCGDFSSKSFQNQTDGALFYKTIEGKGDMPSFNKKIPDEEDIWHLVNYMRKMK